MTRTISSGRGSSPLARGLRLASGGWGVGLGIIPARAGFTPPRRSRPRRPWDHPRSRGVYDGDKWLIRYLHGSSPLARGLPGQPVGDLRRVRIIPARAGFTARSPPARRASPDHPRSRGVYFPSAARRLDGSGSSPLARGLQLPSEGEPAPHGIIPARAGFTGRHQMTPTRHQDHPRSRGVYPMTRATMRSRSGSSPLARGLRHRRLLSVSGTGIIPARAGFTRRAGVQRRTRRDHPRSRGVYATVADPFTGSGGSSPLARGLLVASASIMP